ncbi:MAG TPA: M55 family metallopeptidase [Candidatus Paceibacterota bacterium]|nr:M55 family metallopeptidase [Candidatus Paceibacterota bacterium]
MGRISNGVRLKVFVSADMEGVSGVTHGEHVLRDGKEHERARRLMTGEVNAAVEGALDAGAKKVVVNDSHGTMRNIIPEELHEEAELVTGSPKPMFMMEGIDSSFNAAFFVGYHGMRGSYPSILEHTYSSRVVYDFFINDRVMGETGINAAIAGYYGVPVTLVTGDRRLCEEARTFLRKAVTVVVKEAVGRTAARCISPIKARQLIKNGAAKALEQADKVKPFKIKPPINLKVAFINPGMAEVAELVPGSKRIDGRTLSYTSKDLVEVYRAFLAMITLAGTTA